ncbi:hypothetical protein K438DRAFT_1779317 [Mycena galopus ATCC 62051]|nr:hypothetical protein K438DRAFT_1779317 [Mycena galopus ATCC 62051]
MSTALTSPRHSRALIAAKHKIKPTPKISGWLGIVPHFQLVICFPLVARHAFSDCRLWPCGTGNIEFPGRNLRGEESEKVSRTCVAPQTIGGSFPIPGILMVAKRRGGKLVADDTEERRQGQRCSLEVKAAFI